MITEKNNVFYCDCGFFFERGRSGAHNCETGFRKKLAESEAKLSALAAENANCRNAVQVFCDVVDANTDAICEEVGQDGVKAILAAMSATGNMPATDAFLAEVRAQGVEMLREHPAIKLCSLTHVCDEFAAQIRKGVRS
ncbi:MULTISPECIES: hypothetical protein [Enterobacter cloacae complex]|uniref:hypothetical protein n=1 Tax=Enterobacter cloacae complex TaxID=354276 RepID=UPI0007950F33|nr:MULTISPECIES: hypothetical protein [Enterobacter cloacae complex]MCY0768751.1 hypothetical protein [Enterobacter cloacae complex sp. 2022EL-00787]TYF22260.1 hypothetical protein DJ481_13100 [Enterobacter hormaechei]SAE22200.1 Uncharacterised protein [Enterobacter hormaechei]SAE60375.1 Uncharacterised protein [Enterobacter hormaechei]SAH68738.1 Uncharacterised protein [Enterobacter hormaechei]